jgi:6-phosphogluconolactonase
MRALTMSQIEIFPDPSALARAAAERFIRLAAEAIAAGGQFSVGLSGGSTPRALFALLATAEYARQVDWPNTHFFWGDERCVPPDHPDSNYRMARELLLEHVPLPAENIHRMHGETEPEQAAAEYEQILRMFFAPEEPALPRFDVLLQGLGEDGHTASLFPGTRALYERARWVMDNYVPRLDMWRITLTTTAINAAARVIFLVEGHNKAETLRAVLRGPHLPEKYPAQFIQPVDGELIWMVDEAAAAGL